MERIREKFQILFSKKRKFEYTYEKIGNAFLRRSYTFEKFREFKPSTLNGRISLFLPRTMVPENLKISNLRPGETIQYVLHRHWISLVYTGGYVLLMFLIVVALLSYQGSLFVLSQNSGFMAFFHLAILSFVAFFSLFIYVYWVDNELDFYIVTNERIIGIEQISFLNRTVRECSLDQVQEVVGFAKGLVANLLNFGSVTIHTASDISEFNMNLAPKPLEHARIFLNLIQEYKGTHRDRMQNEAKK